MKTILAAIEPAIRADEWAAWEREQATSDEAVERAGDAFWNKPGNSHEEQTRNVILAALGDET